MGYCTGCRSRCKKPGVPRGSFHVDKGHLEIRDLLPCCGHTAPLTRCIPAGFLRSEWPSHVLFISSSGAGFWQASATRCPLLGWVLPGTWHRSSARYPTAGTGSAMQLGCTSSRRKGAECRLERGFRDRNATCNSGRGAIL